MEIAILLKVVGVGFVVAVANQLLAKAGKDDVAAWVSVAGIVLVLAMLMTRIGDLFDSIRTAFGI